MVPLKLFVAVLYLSILNSVQCSKILGILSSPSRSHHILGSTLLKGLAKKGHDVTVISCYRDEKVPDNYRQIYLDGVITYKDKLHKELPMNGSLVNTMKLLFHGMSGEMADLLWNNSNVQRILKEKPKYDVVIMNMFFNDAVLGIPHHLGAPTILFSMIGGNVITNKYLGNPNPIYVPTIFFKQPKEYTFLERLKIASINVVLSLADCYVDYLQTQVLKKYLPTAPSIRELQNNVDLMLVNSHFSLETPRPYLPNMVQIGGFHTKDVNPLPRDVQNFLDGAQHGAVLFSLGSNVQVSHLSDEQRKIVIESLSKLNPVKVIFKCDIEIKNIPPNMKVMKWLPQNDILAHPNIKAFVTHGGLGGTTEGVYHGVPLVGLPFMADQIFNMGAASDAGYAIAIKPAELTQENFDQALKEIIFNPKYKENIQKRSALLREQPLKPMELAIFWVEHIIKHKGGAHLKNAGLNLNWYETYMVDIILFFAAVIFVLLFISYLSLKLFFKLTGKILFKSNKSDKKQSKSKVKKS